MSPTGNKSSLLTTSYKITGPPSFLFFPYNAIPCMPSIPLVPSMLALGSLGGKRIEGIHACGTCALNYKVFCL